MSDKSVYEEFLNSVLRALVQKPEEIKIEKTTDEMGVLLTVSVAQTDMGIVIGREGQNAKAIRTLLRSVGMKEGARVFLKLNDPAGYKRPERSNFGRDGEFKNEFGI